MQSSLKEISNVKEMNNRITFNGNQMLQVLQEIEFMLISLHKIGSYYFDKDECEYAKETTNFIDNSQICERLAKIRTYLSSEFDLSEGEDEMDDIERACEKIKYWTKPGDFFQEKWLE